MGSNNNANKANSSAVGDIATLAINNKDALVNIGKKIVS